MRHAVWVIVTGKVGVPPVGHCGYVAGLYRDGVLSDTWTDVTRCAYGTFIGYAPACTCGWSGDIRPSTPSGLQDCEQDLITGHLRDLAATQPPGGTICSQRRRSITQPRVHCVSPRFQSASA